MPGVGPRVTALRIGFIGCGRLGKALAWSFASCGLRVAAAASSTRSSAESLAARIPGCVVATAQAVIDSCDLVFVTTPDSVIVSTVEQLLWRHGVCAVHCSGVTEVAALDKAVRQGALTGGFHPMQTFGDPEAAARSLAGCTITIEAEELLNARLVELAERLGCRINRLPPGMRARYHAAAGYTSQFINALFAEAAGIWQSWGGTEEEAVRAMLPMARGTLASIESAGIADGMPGPVSRGDVSSVIKHVAALARLDDSTLELYRQLCERTIALAIRRGAIDARIATQFREALELPFRGEPGATSSDAA